MSTKTLCDCTHDLCKEIPLGSTVRIYGEDAIVMEHGFSFRVQWLRAPGGAYVKPRDIANVRGNGVRK
jgi:hypothetical protein